MTRAAVYNQYWATGGGGETFCGGIAQALAEDGYDVTLLTGEPFDVDRLGERLALDLSGCDQRVVDRAARSVSLASADYDLFVNGSYLSTAQNRAGAGIYVVHFPGSQPATPWYGGLARLVPDGGLSLPVSFTWGDGFHAPDTGAAGAIWTTSDATLDMTVDVQDDVVLHLLFAHLRPAVAGPATVEVRVDGDLVATRTVPAAATGLAGRVRDRAGTVIDVRVPGSSDFELNIKTNGFVPSDLGLGTDTRELGVPLRGVTVGSRSARAVATLAPGVYHRLASQGSPGLVSSYDVVASNSEFTAGFVESWWSIDESPVLYPPVVLRPPAQSKAKRIVAVGRFFDADSGHSKKQVEMVRAFRRLRAGGIDDWTLTFVGGCDPSSTGYLDRVKDEAEGIPVEFLVDASGSDRDQAITEASLFWHATGMGEDARQHPELMEHFGISTVEAMSTGAVPVVFAGGGQLEVVEHGVSGFHFHDLDELVRYSRRLIDRPDEREQLSRAAVRRAAYFGFEPFRERLRSLVDAALQTTGGSR